MGSVLELFSVDIFVVVCFFLESAWQARAGPVPCFSVEFLRAGLAVRVVQLRHLCKSVIARAGNL